MNKKVKILLLTLVLFGSGAATQSVSAASVIPETNGIFSPIGNFFGGLFGGESTTSMDDLTPISPSPEAAATASTFDATNPYASNTAYGTSDGNTDSGTGVIATSEEIVGVQTSKTAVGSEPSRPGVINPADDSGGVWPDDQVNYQITVSNTGRRPEAGSGSGSWVYTVQDDIAGIRGAIQPGIDGSVAANNFTVTTVTDTGDAITPDSTLIADLQDGVDFTGVDPGDEFTIDFSLTMSGIVDFWSTNTTKTCTPITDISGLGADLDTSIAIANGYIHIGENGLPDGTISQNSSGDFFVCNSAWAKVGVDGNMDGGFTLPDLPFLIEKSVVSDGADAAVAAKGDTLTYTLDLTSYDLTGSDDLKADGNTNDTGNPMPDTLYTIKDPLNNDLVAHPSLANVNFDMATPLKDAAGDPLLDASGHAVTIKELKSGFKMDLDALTTTSISFTGTVRTDTSTPAFNASVLEDTRIKNTASMCNAATSTDCVTGDAQINTEYSSAATDLNIDKTLNDSATSTLPGAVTNTIVDSSKFGKLAKGDSRASLDYTITLTNELFEPMEYVTISDVVPSQSYITVDPTAAITVDLDGNTVYENDGTTAVTATTTIGDLQAGLKIPSFNPRSTITIDFSLQISDDLFEDPSYDPFDVSMIAPESSVFTNTAKTCVGTTDYGVDNGCVQASATGSFDVSPIEPSTDVPASILKQGAMSTDTNGNTTIDAGDIMTYTVVVTNDTDENQILNLYDPFDDSAFWDESSTPKTLSSSSNLLSAVSIVPTGATGGYAALGNYTDTDTDGDNDTFTPNSTFTVGDLNAENTVYISLSPEVSASFTFDITLTDNIPDATEVAEDPADTIQNTIDVCIDGTDMTATPIVDCNTSTAVNDLTGDSMLNIEKSSNVGTNAVVDLSETIEYTITVTNNTTTGTQTYKIGDLLPNSQYLDNASVSDVVLTESDKAPAITEIKGGDKDNFFDPTQGYVTDIPYGATDTYTYSVDALDVFPERGGMVRNLVCKEQDTGSIIRSYDISTLGCAAVQDPTAGWAANVDGWMVQKIMVDSIEPGDVGGLAEVGDKLNVSFVVAHLATDSSGVNTIKIYEPGDFTTTPEFDANINYAATAGNSLKIKYTNAAAYDETAPNPEVIMNVISGTTVPKVSDLVSTGAAPVYTRGTGMEVHLAPNEFAVIQFELDLNDGTTNPWTPASEVVNNIAYCKNDGTYVGTTDTDGDGIVDDLEEDPNDDGTIVETERGKCDGTTGIIDTVGFENLSVKKDVMNVTGGTPSAPLITDFDGDDTTTPDAPSSDDVNNDGIPDNLQANQINPADGSKLCDPATATAPNRCIGFYAENGATVTYRIRTTNTGSLPVNLSGVTNNMTFGDVINTEFFDVDDTANVTIDMYDADGTSIALPFTGAAPTNGTLDVGDLIATSSIGSDDEVMLDPGQIIDLTFSQTLKADLDTALDPGNSVTNIGETCYYSEDGYNVFGGVGYHCYESGVDTPFSEDGGDDLTEGDRDDSGFTIDKVINDTGTTGTDAQLEPGEDVTMTITVLNNNSAYNEDGTINEAGTQVINVTDDFADPNFQYDDLLANGAGLVTITGDTTVGSSSATVCANTSDGYAAAVATTTDPCLNATDLAGLTALNLLPKAGYLNEVNPSFDYDAESGSGEAYANDERGGITLEVPANQVYTITFDTNAEGSLRTVSKVRNFFDIKKYFV